MNEWHVRTCRMSSPGAQEFIMNPEFTDAQESFCKSNCGEFEDTDENKLVYTEVFDRHGRPSAVVRRPLHSTRLVH